MQYTCRPTEKDRALFKKNVLPYAVEAKKIPFSFTVGGKEKLGFGKTPVKETYEVIDGNIERRTFTARFRLEKLEVTAETLVYMDYPVAEWVIRVKNVGKTPSAPISNLVVAKDLRLASPNAKLHHNTGDGYRKEGLETTISPMLKGETLTFAPLDGRSCDGAFPYYRLESPNFGYNMAIGWAGMWQVAFTGGNNHTKITLGQKDCNFYLNPGEEVRTPRLALQVYDGKTERGVNAWRRFYMAHVMPKWQGKPLEPILFMHDNGGGEEFTQATTENQLSAIKTFVDKGFKIDCWWIDAGWYPCYGDDGNKFWPKTGDWRCDPAKWQNEFTEVSNDLHKRGIKLLVWFEPERTYFLPLPGPIPEEYILRVTKTDENGKPYVDPTYLFNMGNEKARKWMADKINGILSRNHIDIYRQDFNVGPLLWWQQNDGEGRCGITENHHVTGYLAFWDELKRVNNGILIDSCASGGRRNDYDTMKRAVPFHYTDYGYGYHAVKQAFTQTMFGWIPYFRNHTMSWDYTDGTYQDSGPYSAVSATKMSDIDNYAYHTAFAPSITCLAPLSVSEEETAYCLKMNDIWRRAAKYTLCGDYYPLTPFSKELTGWYCLQFHDDVTESGVINAVRNTQAEESVIHLSLRQIDEKATYAFECPETDETFEISGKDLAKHGLAVSLPKRSGLYFFYKKVQ